MFRNLSPYGDTRPTTLPWASTLPRHWRIERAKTVMRTVDVRSAAGEEELLTVSSKRGVVPRASAKVSMFRAESYVGHKLCWPDDLVINSLWAWGRGLGVARHHGIVSTAYGVYRQRKADLDPSYLNELVRSEPFQWELQVRSQGVWKSRLQISDERWLDAPLLVPPAEEQAAIVKYLVHANARIDKAVAAKRRLMALLEEQERALVEELIDASAVGAPAPLFGRALHRIDQGLSPSAIEGELADGQWAVLSLSAVNRGTFVSSALKPVASNLRVPDGLELGNGDLLMSRSNTRERVGDVAVVEGVRPRTFMPDLIYRLVLRENLLSSDFASHLLRTRRVRNQIESMAKGSSDTMPKLSQRQIKSLRICLPDLRAQRAVVEEVSRQTEPIVSAAMKARKEIALIQEFRTRLVADVVTGQVDVRAAAASLPDTPEQDPELDSLLDDDLEDVLGEGEE